MSKLNLSIFPGILKTWEEKSNNKKNISWLFTLYTKQPESTTSRQGRVMYFVIEFCEGGDLFDRWDCPPYADVEGEAGGPNRWLITTLCHMFSILSHGKPIATTSSKQQKGKQGSLNYLFWGDQTMQM